MKSDYIDGDVMRSVLGVLTTENRLACYVSLCTGLRIGDVLCLKTEDVQKGTFSIFEQKTGKRRKIRLDKKLQEDLIRISGRVFVFEGRFSPLKTRTRQAVYKDLKRAAECFRLPAALVVSPHSCRKIYAVTAYKRTCSIKTVQKLLNHSSEAVTALYALADAYTEKHKKLTPRQFATMSVGQ